jgi:hypothetical protein
MRNVQAGSWWRGCFQPTRMDKPRHFGDVMLTGKLLSLIVKLKMENYHNRTEYATNGPPIASQTMLFNSINPWSMLI